jgi:uncharacterized ubiquitin-like protein YukD
MSLGELQISFPLFLVPKNSPNDIISETLTVKKLIKVVFFTIKIHYTSSQNDSNTTHTKHHTLIDHIHRKNFKLTCTFSLSSHKFLIELI